MRDKLFIIALIASLTALGTGSTFAQDDADADADLPPAETPLEEDEADPEPIVEAAPPSPEEPSYVPAATEPTTGPERATPGEPAIDEAPRPERWFADNYIGLDLVGALGFLRLNIGNWRAYYEHVFARHHGVAVAFELIHVHQDAAHVQDHQWTFGGSLSYRYYFGPGVGGFVGAIFGYHRGYGRVGEEGDADYTELGNEQFRALAQFGYRFWVPDALLSFVPRIALGYGEYQVWAEGRSDAVAEANVQFARDVLAPLPFIFELELSVAIGFN